MAGMQTFTPFSLDNLKTGKLLDPQVPGLSLEVSAKGAKIWKYRRCIPGRDTVLKSTLGPYPAHTIAKAREWARAINEKVEQGIDPREEARAEARYNSMTVARAHELYMEAVREGRASRSKRPNKPRTIKDKLKIYRTDIEPILSKRIIHKVTEDDLVELVIEKGKTAKVRANRLASELKVFFGWTAGLRGKEVGLKVDPARRLHELRFPEEPRRRKLSLEEIELYLKAVALEEERDFRRGLVLWLLTATRFSELVCGRSEEVVDGVWTIPPDRSKNNIAHSIALGPWGLRLLQTNSEWFFPAPIADGPRTQGWYEARDRVLAEMREYSGQEVEHFNPHDLRRTVRSNTKRLKLDFETAEAMLNHQKPGLARIYDGYEHEEEKAAWFLKWEHEIISLARKAGVAEILEVPSVMKPNRSWPVQSGWRRRQRPATMEGCSPEGTGLNPGLDLR